MLDFHLQGGCYFRIDSLCGFVEPTFVMDSFSTTKDTKRPVGECLTGH